MTTPDDHDLTEDPNTIVDDDGHTLADITPWDVDEPDEATIQAELDRPEDPAEHANWDRDRDGGMWEYATDDEPECQSGDNAEKGV